MNHIKMLVFDIDGVITDGKEYINKDGVIKTISLKDLDAIRQLQESSYIVGCISGEDTDFSRSFVQTAHLGQARLGCKEKDAALENMARQNEVPIEEVCYVGDGKYDIPALKIAGLALCPFDAITEVKQVVDRVLNCKGGDGCIAEIYTLLTMRASKTDNNDRNATILKRMNEHRSILACLMEMPDSLACIEKAAGMIVNCYGQNGRVLICGNGGSAADAQHLVGELVGRFYLERRALDAEALTTNTSVITSLANDYDYDMIFARQVEAKALKGDVLIGITTSGTSKNICRAFAKAKQCGVLTILMTGDISADAEILQDTDCLITVPAKDTPRIQEMHILIGHIICELVERETAE